MERKKYYIEIDKVDKTEEIENIAFDGKMFYIKFHKNAKTYNYNNSRIKYYKLNNVINASEYVIYNKDKEILNNIDYIAEFSNIQDTKIYIRYKNSDNRYYDKNDLTIHKNNIQKNSIKTVLNYFIEIVKINKQKLPQIEESIVDKNGLIKNLTLGDLLLKYYEKIEQIEDNSLLDYYFDWNKKFTNSDNSNINKCGISDEKESLVFPFDCNNSQIKAVDMALKNRISIIEGPPGTGKTQSIINIIANLLIRDKTVLVVSNNNSAVENIIDKFQENNLGFLVAKLGNSVNKQLFLNTQNGSYPNMSAWEHKDIEVDDLTNQISVLRNQINDVFIRQENNAKLKLELSKMKTEFKHFNEEVNNIGTNSSLYINDKNVGIDSLYSLWMKLQYKCVSKKGLTFFEKIWYRYVKRIGNEMAYKLPLQDLKNIVQYFYYKKKIDILEREIKLNTEMLDKVDCDNLLIKYKDLSNVYVKKLLFIKYKNKKGRIIFEKNDFQKRAKAILKEYPIITSTTFSAKNTLDDGCRFDYVIMDESSQVDIATGALAMACANNIVIVGDLKQLPNVVNDIDKEKCDKVLNDYNLPKCYSFSNSFMKSIIDVINPPRVLLKEHYRCHPQIIEFCNKKFYDEQLIIMRSDEWKKDVITEIITNIGNHSRLTINERQADIIKKEIMPNLQNYDSKNIGIIAPYRDQVELIKNKINNKDVEVDTIHKFQGRGKDVIIMSTVKVNDFVDNANLLNVAISRAKEKFIILITENEHWDGDNIFDLVSYIRYNNCQVRKSSVSSIFDLLYKQYTNERLKYLKKHKHISKYDSENLMYALVQDIFSEYKFDDLDIIFEYPLKNLIKDYCILTDKEKEYANHSGTHLDFLIYTKYDKSPVLVIEVDGYKYHKTGTIQYERDELKNSILDKLNIKYNRFKTTGSDEKAQIKNMLFEWKKSRT